MIPTTDGSFAKAFFDTLEPAAAQTLRDALQAAITKTAQLSAEAAGLGAIKACEVLEHLTEQQATDVANNAIQAITDNVLPIDNTAMDAAIAVLAAHPACVPNIAGAVTAAAAGAALAGGLKIGRVRGDLYRAGSALGDVEAIASGNPQRMARRIGQHVFWRAFGRAGRSIFRAMGGKR